MKTLLKNRELSAFFAIVALFVVLVALFVVLVALNPAYFSLQTLAMIFASSQILCLLALGATLVMLTRNIDVSVGSTVGLCAIAVGVALNNGYGLATAIAFALAIGALAGAFNGLLVVGLRIPAIVATLGTLGLYRGVMLLWTGGKWIEGLPDSLKSLSEPAFIGVSPLGWLVLALLLAGGWLLSRTAFGRDFYAVGDNLAAARQLGVAVNRTRMLAFTLNGMLAACAGIVFAAQIGFVPNQTGSGLEMKAIAACVLGGISLLGGTGTLLGAFLGAFFLTQIDTVLVLFRLPAWWNDFIAGLVLLGVLVLDGRLRQALARHQRALKYSRFQPGNKGGKQVARFPERKSKEVA
ncbi:TPA: autoinducer 2 ABC transporter permease LsrC [Klebsiella pneumoniae]|nr:autoinducer 2 ABC transporter permease LsrC [Klebsiella pneumoniae]